jgi:predicted ATP-dependent endonuclease of OLD family
VKTGKFNIFRAIFDKYVLHLQNQLYMEMIGNTGNSEIISFTIKDFRAIKEAEIILNGITVATGINGCGKSTLSKFLYYTFNIANNYNYLVYESLSIELSDIFNFLDILQRERAEFDGQNHTGLNSAYNVVRQKFLNKTIGPLDKELVLKLILTFKTDYQKHIDIDTPKAKAGYNRLTNILRNTLGISETTSDYLTLTDKLYDRTEKIFNKAEETLNRRPSSLLVNKLSKIFFDSHLPDNFEICEYGDIIIGKQKNTIPVIHSVQKTAYIDTPMALGIAVAEENHWNDLNEILKVYSDSPYNRSIDEIIKSDILQGESHYEKSELFEDKFTFKKDGSTYNLLECATGVKSFSILQLMLRNGFLTPNTLLIIDEPEAHLHPQWIVEYARLIVLLNKHIGVKFFIASHSPDMISAIRYISEKEDILPSLNYYLAESTNNNKFIYKNPGTNIEPVFESFNIALDRINQYGVSNIDVV